MLMEIFLDSLKRLRNSLPVNCTQDNLLKLRASLNTYKQLVNNLPVKYQQIRTEYADNFRFLEFKIDAIADPSNSAKDAKYYFRDALHELQNDIDGMIESIANVSALK